MSNNNKTANKTKKLRLAAEEFLNKNKKGSDASYSESDALKYFQELEIHQVELQMQNEELEMQNEELKRARKIAELAEQKYTELYEFAPSGYLTLTKEGDIIDLNNSAAYLLGKERSKLIKSRFGFFVSFDTRDVYNHFLQTVFKTRLKETCELKLETSNDSVKYILVNGIISNIDEKCLVTLVDITSHKHTEKDLINAREKAEESDRLKSAFLANMSHEIRTPMNGILGFTELLKTLELNSKEQQRYIGIIDKSGKRMLNIINDIINISKIDSQQIEVSVSETDVSEQVEYIYHFFKLEAEQKKLNISYKDGLNEDERFIWTDREKIYAVLTNLVKNAIKFTQSGSIELGCGKKGEFIEFYVKDSGPGIPEEQQEIIFERFRQGSESFKRIYEGAGLGLSISKAYVEMLEGKIWVENNTNKRGKPSGATFFFTIPAHPVKEVSHIPHSYSTAGSEKNINIKLKILIAEDDEYSEMLITKLIERYSSEILIARTGVEAIDICRKNPDIDLILMDINMPEMNGYEATRKIREFNKNVVIVSQTAYALEGDRKDSIAAGCTDYISKPISQAKLTNIISNHLEKDEQLDV